jgi:hypothetical protein
MNTIPRPCSYRQTDVRQVGWLDSAALMMKTQIGLGVLSIPAVFNSLGMIPGIRVGTGQFSELVHQFELPVLEVDQFSIRELVDQFSAENCPFELAVPPAVLRQSFNWSG